MTSVPSCLLNSLPVVHPPHLDGDPSLATEILPGPPSLDSVKQQLAKKNEPRKFGLPSYLPLSDPGTTYTSLAGGMASMALHENGPRRKRARVDKGISNRTQRASARHFAGNISLNNRVIMLDEESASTQPGVEDGLVFNEEDRSTSHSRSASVPTNGETQAQSASENGVRITNGKGKGKEKENPEKVAQMRVKEEPINLQLSDLPAAGLTNEDHCSSCSSIGSLVYCDGCPRAFHLWCLDPPMDPSDFPEGEESWFCPSCKPDKRPPPRTPHTLLSPLIQQLENAIPTEFRLPEEMRSFFRDVGTGPGGVYVDNSSVKVYRIGRHGFGEERDPYRLKDNKGAPVICFRCGKSALPDEPAYGNSAARTRRASAVLSQSQHWKSVISCDFCPLHWHVDCLDPPLTSLPPVTRKWKCPNHASGSAPKMRTPRTAAPPIDVTEPHQRNNGNIEIINSEIPSRSEEKMSVDEVLINGRRYRVPERIIVLDFWSKVRQQKTSKISRIASAASSPLTSLSSLDDSVDQSLPPLTLNDRPLDDDNSLQVAELLCQLQSRGPSLHSQNTSSHHNARGRFELVASERPPAEHRNKEPTDIVHMEGRRIARTRPQRLSASLTSAPKRGGVNGIPSSRPNQTLASHRTLRHESKRNESISSVSTRSLRNSTKAEVATQESHGGGTMGHDRLAVGSNTIATNEVPVAKPSSSTLKIRIPGRLLQKQSSIISSTSTSESAQPASSMSALQARPRRSLRRHASMTGTGSERSMSIDHGHDVS